MALACTLPILAYAAYLLLWSSSLQRQALEQQLLIMARAARVSVDAEIQSAIVALETLRVSAALEADDIDEFARRARAVADQHKVWTGVILVRPDGQQLFNLAALPGRPLPNIADYDVFKRVMATGKPAISDLLIGRVLPEPLVAIEVPVTQDGQIRYVIGTSLRTEHLRSRLSEAIPRADTRADLVDSKFVIAARTDMSTLVGKPTSPWLANAIHEHREGIAYGRGFAGQAVSAFSRSELSGWSVVVSVEDSYLESVADRSLRALYIGGAGLLLFALLLTFLIVSRISRPVARLAASADAYVRGETVIPAAPSGVSEVDKLAETLRAAGVERRRLAEDQSRALLEIERGWHAETLAAQAREADIQFRSLADAMPVLMSYVGPDLRYRFANRAYEEWYGVSAEKIRGMPARDLIGDEAMRASLPYIKQALAGRPVRFEKPLAVPNGGVRHVAVRYVPRRRADGSVEGFYALLFDLSERKRAEDHRQLLINELNHRVKNTLTTVQSMARQTARSAPDLQVFTAAFEARLLGLAETHDVLTRENWAGAALREIVGVSMQAWADRVTISGPDLRITARVALAISMALHELATNAAKYGALKGASAEGGRVILQWHVVQLGGTDSVLLEWAERGGPPVAVPERKGFGSRLLERGLAQELGGTVLLDYRPTGVYCRIQFSADRSSV